MRSARRLVDSRWALMMRVTESCSICSMMSAWVRFSSQLVASSSSSTWGLRARAAASMKRCTWPPEKAVALSLLTVYMRMGIAAMSASTRASRAARHASSSFSSPSIPMRLSSTVWGRRWASWGTVPILLRTDLQLSRFRS